jgi:hypothetical protein
MYAAWLLFIAVVCDAERSWGCSGLTFDLDGGRFAVAGTITMVDGKLHCSSIPRR